jgi:hypothetical protein
MSRRPALNRDAGQAAVELVALLPVIALVLLAAWQAVLAGHAAWAAAAAARAAARAAAVGASPQMAARRHLPARLEHGLEVDDLTTGAVRVSVRIPRLVRALPLGRATATGTFTPQERP